MKTLSAAFASLLASAVLAAVAVGGTTAPSFAGKVNKGGEISFDAMVTSGKITAVSNVDLTNVKCSTGHGKKGGTTTVSGALTGDLKVKNHKFKGSGDLTGADGVKVSINGTLSKQWNKGQGNLRLSGACTSSSLPWKATKKS